MKKTGRNTFEKDIEKSRLFEIKLDFEFLVIGDSQPLKDIQNLTFVPGVC